MTLSSLRPPGMASRLFDRSLTLADRAGIPHSRVLLDPGVGFGKTRAQNLKALALTGALRGAFGLPTLIGAVTEAPVL
jgi:dihydropteroate synthase